MVLFFYTEFFMTWLSIKMRMSLECMMPVCCLGYMQCVAYQMDINQLAR